MFACHQAPGREKDRLEHWNVRFSTSPPGSLPILPMVTITRLRKVERPDPRDPVRGRILTFWEAREAAGEGGGRSGSSAARNADRPPGRCIAPRWMEY